MTKEEAIKHLRTYSSTNGSGQTTQDQHEEAKKMAIKALSEQQWIPVSETVDIPEHEVLACDKYGTELIGFICEKDEQWMCESDECFMYDVVAYMPLPEPYRGE